jgi:phenylacetate-CoA ligase
MLDFSLVCRRLAEVAVHSPRIARQLQGIDVAALKSTADFAAVPLLRKSDLTELQRQDPPFAGIAKATSGFKRLFMSPGPIFEGEDHGEDPYGAKRAFTAAGVTADDIVLNCFSYHLTPGAFIIESGAHALGCAVIPAGTGNTELTLQAIAHLRPTAYVGPPDFLKILLDKAGEAGVDASSIRKALVSGGALPPSLRAEVEARGVRTRQAYATAELGVIAYETDGSDGAVAPGLEVNDDVFLEIVRPGAGDPLPEGTVGEVVVTALRGRFPVLRFATGDLSAFLDATRIRGWLGRADQTTKVKGMFVHPSAIVEAAKRHPEIGAVRLIVRREGEQDVMTLMAETEAASDALAEKVAASLQATTKLRGRVEFVAPGTLPNDGKTIADERAVG